MARHKILVHVFALIAIPLAALGQDPRIALTVQDDEARAALAILDTLASRTEPSPATWTALWTSDGYHRLQRREAAMGRAFTDSSFARFLHADTMIARRQRLRTTLDAWRQRDAQGAARQALNWLPTGARIHATIYLLVKPYGNSFVFETDTDPAIMLFLDPGKAADDYANEVTHELHHIGYSSVCTSASPAATDRVGQARLWLGAFGEGLAMLAAADGPANHPHATSPAADRARWDRDVRNFDADLRSVEGFVRGVLDGTIAGDSILAHARVFYGVQGPWYTVGWKMAAVVTEERGKDTLRAVMCDPVAFLAAFNAAVPAHERRTGERLATWDPAVLKGLGAKNP